MPREASTENAFPRVKRDPIRIGEWIVHPQLLRFERGQDVVQVGPRLVELLLCLADSAGEVVSRDELLDTIWNGTVIAEEGLTVAVSELRKILGDRSSAPRYIETIRGVGYRLVAQVAPVAADVETSSLESETPRSVQPANERLDLPYRDDGTGIERSSHRLAVILVALLSAVMVAAFFVLRPSTDLHTVEIVPLTAMPGSEIQPAIAPDESRVVFAWRKEGRLDHDLFLTAPGADSATRLTFDDSDDLYPEWSADGETIFFARRRSGLQSHESVDMICSVPVSGGEARRLISTRGQVEGMSASPDGRLLAYCAPAEVGGESFLWLYDFQRRSSAPVPILGETHFARRPRFSSDGRHLAFIGGSRLVQHIYSYEFETGKLRRITLNSRRIAGLDWGADDASIVFASAVSGPFQLWRVNLQDGAIVHVETLLNAASEPVIGRHTHELVYQSSATDINVWKAEIPSHEGEELTVSRLISSTRLDGEADVSPSGDHIVFVSARSGHRELWVTDIDGRGPRRLTSMEGVFITRPRWSPDGQKIAFSAVAENGQAGFYLIDATGGTPQDVTVRWAQQFVADWDTTSRFLFGYAFGTSNWLLFRLDLEERKASAVGSEVARLVGVASDDQLVLEDGSSNGIYLFDRTSRETRWLVNPNLQERWLASAMSSRALYLLQEAERGMRLVAIDLESRTKVGEWPVPIDSELLVGNLLISPDGSFLLFDLRDEGAQSDLILNPT